MRPSTLPFVSYITLRGGSGNLAIQSLYLFLPLFLTSINTFFELVVKFPCPAFSLYVCSLGSISFISLYSIFAPSVYSRKSEVFFGNKVGGAVCHLGCAIFLFSPFRADVGILTRQQ